MTSDQSTAHKVSGRIVPFGDVVKDLLDGCFKALKELIACKDLSDSDLHRQLNEFFPSLKKNVAQDPHIRDAPGARQSFKTRDGSFPHYPTRISFHLTQSLNRALQALETGASKNTICLPSPFEIVFNILTSPSWLASRAYALATLRVYLFDQLRVYPRTKRANLPELKPIDFADIESAMQIITSQWRGGYDIEPVDESVGLVCHLLAMKGFMYMRFEGKDKEPQDVLSGCIQFCESENIRHKAGYNFNVFPDIERLPDAAEVINELWGTPIAIEGIETIFLGGLRSAYDGGTVISVSGGAGSGKTSFALGLGAALAPLGTTVIYFTTEEKPEDLEARLTTLTPNFVRRTYSYDKDRSQWFHPYPILDPASDRRDRQRDLQIIMKQVEQVVAKSTNHMKYDVVTMPAPFLVVLDGLHRVIGSSPSDTELDVDGEPTYSLECFVRDCRGLGSIVVLTSALTETLKDLDYLVDVIIRVSYQHTDNLSAKPLRVFSLTKTRLQGSRLGSHVCHVSGERGFRLSPQLPSQLDRGRFFKFRLPDQSVASGALMIRVEAGVAIPSRKHDRAVFLKVFVDSHTLVHGLGSTGKASFGMKVLLAPVCRTSDGQTDPGFGVRRILVVSFCIRIISIRILGQDLLVN